MLRGSRTMVLILFGCGVVAQVVTGGTPLSTAPGATGDYNSVAWGWGLGVTITSCITSEVSCRSGSIDRT